MPVFDFTLHVPELITAFLVIVGALKFFHAYDKKIDLRHAENSDKLEHLDEGQKEIKNDLTGLKKDHQDLRTDVAVLKSKIGK